MFRWVLDIFDGKDPLRRAMAWSLGISVLMLLGKVGAFFVTGSTAILSDATESIIHIVATGLAAWSTWYAVQPPSKSSPYGYGKIAYFSAGFEGSLIFMAALAIIYQAVVALIQGPRLQQLDIGFIMIAFLTGVNLALGLYLVRTGRKHNSLILVANGKHVLTDMWTSVAVVVGVGVVWLTDILWLDPAFAIFAALNIMYSAVLLLKESYSGLMEHVDSAEGKKVVVMLREAIQDDRLSDFHQLRFRRVYNQVWVELHLLFPGEWTLERAHDAASSIEADLLQLFPKDQVVITSHLEPKEHEGPHPEGHPGAKDPFCPRCSGLLRQGGRQDQG